MTSFSEVYLLLSGFILQGFWKKGTFSPFDPMSRKWEPDWSLSLESVSQILEETRIIQDPDQFYRQTRSKVNSSGLDFNIHKGVLLKLLKMLTLFSLWKSGVSQAVLTPKI